MRAGTSVLRGGDPPGASHGSTRTPPRTSTLHARAHSEPPRDPPVLLTTPPPWGAECPEARGPAKEGCRRSTAAQPGVGGLGVPLGGVRGLCPPKASREGQQVLGLGSPRAHPAAPPPVPQPRSARLQTLPAAALGSPTPAAISDDFSCADPGAGIQLTPCRARKKKQLGK